MPFLTPLRVEALIEEDDQWRLVAPLVYQTRWGLPPIEVPTGFETDLASIPSGLRSLIRVNGRHRRAAALHDYLYHYGIGSRVLADLIFLHAMEDDGVREPERKTLYMGVRLGGGHSWKA